MNSINDDDDDIVKTQKFIDLKEKCEELVKEYKRSTETTDDTIPIINLKLAEYSDLFENTKKRVLAGIRVKMTTTLGTLAQLPSDDRGAGLIGEIDVLLNSVDS